MHSCMGLRCILLQVVQLDIDTLALVVVLEVVSILRRLFKSLLILFKRILVVLYRWLVFLLQWLIRFILVNPWNDILIRRG